LGNPSTSIWVITLIQTAASGNRSSNEREVASSLSSYITALLS
jgi:hypothetical protein